MPKKKKPKSLEQIFRRKNWYSFFDYEVLGVIISVHCTELEDNLKEYIVTFNAYCNRRVSEVPTCFTSNASGGNNFILRVKIDKEFSNITMGQLKELEISLKNIIKIHLHLLRLEDGCIVVAFESLNEEDDMLPLTDEEKKELIEMDVLKLYSDNEVYFDHVKYSCLMSSEPHFLHEIQPADYEKPSPTVCSETSVGKSKSIIPPVSNSVACEHRYSEFHSRWK